MKNIFFLLLLFTISCTSEDAPEPETQKKRLEIVISGNSPECYISTKNGMIYLRESHITRDVEKGDIITAIGFTYSIDNSNNYNAQNVTVLGTIVIKINGVIVKEGINNLTYQVN